jgi:hypothetical protein
MGALNGESTPGILASASWAMARRTTDATRPIQSQQGPHQHIVGVHGTKCMHLLSTGAHDVACVPNIVAYANNYNMYLSYIIFPVLSSDNTTAVPNKCTTDITEDYRNCSTSTSLENVYMTGLCITGIAVSIEYYITGTTTSLRRALNYHWYHNTQRHAIS